MGINGMKVKQPTIKGKDQKKKPDDGAEYKEIWRNHNKKNIIGTIISNINHILGLINVYITQNWTI
jgi:hypothetical protein